MLIFQPPVNFCSDENIHTIFGINLEDFLNYRIDYNSISQTVEKVVKKIFFSAPKASKIGDRQVLVEPTMALLWRPLDVLLFRDKYFKWPYIWPGRAARGTLLLLGLEVLLLRSEKKWQFNRLYGDTQGAIFDRLKINLFYNPRKKSIIWIILYEKARRQRHIQNSL
jgi:hypothetical protein